MLDGEFSFAVPGFELELGLFIENEILRAFMERWT